MICCKIYHCTHQASDLCCAYCDRIPCNARCENHPDRCGVWQEQPDIKRRKKVKRIYDHGKVLALYNQGLSRDDIAKQIGCAKSTVALILRNNGIWKGSGKNTQIDHDMIRTLHDVGLTNKEIAQRLGCSEPTVSLVLRGKVGRRNG